MSFEALKAAKKKSIGTKQTYKAINRGKAVEVFVAKDADERVVRGIITACAESGVKLTYVESMALLGRACGIEVSAAAAAILSE